MRSALLATSLALAACGSGMPDDGRPAATQRLRVRATNQDAPAAVQMLRELTAAEAAKGVGWRLDPALDAQLVSYSSGTSQGRALTLPGHEVIEIGISLEEGHEVLNQLALTLVVQGTVNVHVMQGAAHESGPRTRRQKAEGRNEPVTLVFDLPGYEWPGGVSRELTIFLRTELGSSKLVSAALIRRPLERWLPSPRDGSSLVDSDGHESRRAYGLASQRALEAEFDAGEGERLVFSHCVPQLSRGQDRDHAVAVTLRDEHGAESRRTFSTPYEWRAESLSLSAFRGRVSARFELELKGGTEGVVALGEPSVERPRANAPTVVLITSDTHRADHLGALDNGLGVLTPALDRLAERGLLFEDCVASANVTLPSHVALMTGTPPRDSGVVYNADYLGDGPETLAEIFRDAGWVTYASVGAAALRDRRSGLGQGFDRMGGPSIGFGDAKDSIDQILGWIGDAEDLPLFVWLHLFDAHTPYRPQPALPRYYPKDRDPADPSLPELEPWKTKHVPDGTRDLDYVVGLYRSEVTYLDDQLKRVFEHSRLGRGILAFTADHGESLTEHDIYFGHQELFPQTLAVPLILAWPDGPEGRRVKRPVEQIDVGRTILSLAGLEPGDFPGALLSEEGDGAPRFALAAGAQSASVYAGSWFFVMHLRDHPRSNPDLPPYRKHEVELYDRSSDPDCYVDLAAERPEDAARLRELLIDWLLDARSMGWNVTGKAADLDALEELAALGYTTDYRDSSENLWFDEGCECANCRAFE